MEQGAVRKGFTKFGVGLIAGLLVVLVVGPARSAVPASDAHVTASATGTVLHAGALQSGDTRLVDAEVAFSGAAYDSNGIHAAANEMDRKFTSTVDAKAFGRGSALEAGLAVTPNDDNQIIAAGKAESTAGEVTKEIGPVDLGPLAWANLLRGRASAAHISGDCVVGSDLSSGSAYAADAQLLDMGAAPASASSKPASSSSIPTVSSPTSTLQQTVDAVTKPVTGLLGSLTGSSAPTTSTVSAPKLPLPSVTKTAPKATANAAAEHEGLARPLAGVDATGPARAVSQSRSRTLMVVQKAKSGALLGHDFGVMSEVRETIAPVTLLKGTPSEFTIEFLGEWVLQAVSTGMPGGSYIHYGPGEVSPSTPVVRILRSTGVTNILKLQDLLGAKGLVVNIPGIAEVAIGEDPRAIGGDADTQPQVASDGTSASAAVDVVRVRLLPGLPAKLADIRVGHMEVRTAVPNGGVRCPVPVTKKASVDSVPVGDTFTTTFEVSNNTNCVLRNVRLTDHVTTEGDARFEVTSTNPTASGVPDGAATEATLSWTDLPDIPVGGHDTVVATFRAADGPGAIVDKATGFGDPSDCAQAGSTVGGVAVSVVGATLNGPSNEVRVPVTGGVTVGAAVAQPTSGELPRTGAPIALIVLGSLGLLAAGGAALTLAYRMR